MISINLPKNLTFGMKLLYGILAVSVIVVIVCVIIFSRNTYLAKSMKLVRAEGTVKIEQEGGKLRQIKKNARFQSGEALVTYAGSLASVNLDDTKIITLQENSRAEFTKMNKQLALKLTQGALFFEVTQKLNADEIFEIKTSTITAGIKGTSGYFYTDEEGRETLTVTDGKVIISAVNPETGERKYAEVSGGQRLVVNLYSESNKEHDTIELKVTDLVEEELEDFVLKMLGDNERLLDRVCGYTGWDRAKLRELINAYIVSNLSISDTTPSSEESSEEPSEPETSPEDTETQGATDNTPTPAPTGKETEKKEATPTPKPKATTAPKAKATATPKPKPKATATPVPKPTTGTSESSSGSSETDPTSGGGGSDPTSGGGGGSDPTSGGGGGSDPTSGGGGGSDPTSGGGEPTSGGGSSSGGGTSSGGESGGGGDAGNGNEGGNG